MAIDQYGLYVQADGDQGDCAHRTGSMLAYFALKAPLSYQAWTLHCIIKRNLMISPGIYIRHPDPVDYYANPKEFSRDQASRIIVGYACADYKEPIRQWLRARAKAFFLHQNGDLMGPGEWANIIRGLSLWYLYPLLCLIDLKFLGDLLNRQWQKWDLDALILWDLLLAKRKYPTPIIPIVCWLYRKTDFKECLRNNHDPINKNGCVELQEASLEAAEWI